MKSIIQYLSEVKDLSQEQQEPQIPQIQIKNTLPIDVITVAKKNPAFAAQVNTQIAELKKLALLSKLRPNI